MQFFSEYVPNKTFLSRKYWKSVRGPSDVKYFYYLFTYHDWIEFRKTWVKDTGNIPVYSSSNKRVEGLLKQTSLNEWVFFSIL